MTLRSKTLIVIGGAILCSLLIIYAISATILMRPFAQLDEDGARKNAARARDALSENIANLSAAAGDYAAWDETCTFIRDRNAGYVRRNLADDAFLNLGVEAMIFVDTAGRIVFSKTVDAGGRGRGRQFNSQSLLAHLTPGAPLVHHTGPRSSAGGVLMLPDGPELVASRPIVASDGKGPVRGALIMARPLGIDLLNQIAKLTHLTLSLRRFQNAAVDSQAQAAISKAAQSDKAVAVLQTSGRTAGYVVLTDLSKQPILIVKAQSSEATYELGRTSVHYFVVALVLVGLVLGLIGLLLLERAVLSRLARLSAAVRNIESSGDLSARLREAGEDELSHLAGAINGMLSALERSQGNLRESEERYRAFVEQSSEGMWRLEIEEPLPISLPEEEQIQHLVRFGVIAEANDIMARMHGYARADEIVGTRLNDVLADGAASAGHIRAFIRGGYRLTDAVTEQLDADGKPRCFLNQIIGIVEEDRLVRAWGIRRDISARRRAEALLRMQISAINAATDQILITDPEGRITFANAAFERETGYAADEVIGRDVRAVESGKHDRSFYDGLWKAVREGKTWRGELVCRRKNGGIFTADTIITPVKNDKGETEHLISIKRDITQKKVYEEQLDRIAHHDSLTGLPNRLLLNDRLDHQLSHARQHGQLLAVMFLDLDRFKFINDALGHSVGDQLLKLVSQRLTKLLRWVDAIARTGGDEFTVIISGISSHTDAAKVAQRVLDAFAEPFPLSGHDLFVSASIGISVYPADGADAETLIKHADAAMYRAKEHGRNTYQFFTRALSDAALQRMTLERRLRRALSRDGFEIHYQPRVDVALRAVLGAEALLRWRQPGGALVYPAQFIPVAEETGLIVPITRWVLRTACLQNRAWQSEGFPTITVEVNVSAHQLHRSDLIEMIKTTLDDTGMDARYLGLEITESALMRNPEVAIRALRKLKEMGVSLLIDDFGTGHSSLSHLKRLPVDAVKIDRSFVSNITANPDDAAIASAIVAMAHSLKLRVIAEGVERTEQLDFLRDIECDEIQGCLISPPVPAAEFGLRLRASSPAAVAPML